jgi:pimeloyl-ACP methyl ester carboxylesterase
MGSRLLYLHGFASSPASKKAQYFAGRFEQLGMRLEVPDLAEGNFEGLTISGQLGVVQRAARGEAVSLIGSSLGGYLAALYASRHPEVEKVVLLAPAFEFGRRWREHLGEAQVEQWRRTGFLSVYHFNSGREERLGYRLLDDALQYEDYPSFGQPVLLLHGFRDEVVPPSLSEEFARRHRNARLRLLDSGHELLNVLDVLWEEVSGFLGAAKESP